MAAELDAFLKDAAPRRNAPTHLAVPEGDDPGEWRAWARAFGERRGDPEIEGRAREIVGGSASDTDAWERLIVAGLVPGPWQDGGARFLPWSTTNTVVRRPGPCPTRAAAPVLLGDVPGAMLAEVALLEAYERAQHWSSDPFSLPTYRHNARLAPASPWWWVQDNYMGKHPSLAGCSNPRSLLVGSLTSAENAHVHRFDRALGEELPFFISASPVVSLVSGLLALRLLRREGRALSAVSSRIPGRLIARLAGVPAREMPDPFTPLLNLYAGGHYLMDDDPRNEEQHLILGVRVGPHVRDLSPSPRGASRYW